MSTVFNRKMTVRHNYFYTNIPITKFVVKVYYKLLFTKRVYKFLSTFSSFIKIMSRALLMLTQNTGLVRVLLKQGYNVQL